ncbi:MAG: enoyl-CoA hydratase/isomerase family protein [Candidatus Bathyarchaeia archaeon]
MSKDILTEKKGRALYITINRPERLNSITKEMLREIYNALNEAEGDDEIRCVVITGAGEKSFSAGANIKSLTELSKEEAREFSRTGHKTFTKIIEIGKPVIAAINGYALGGGCELSAFCDLRIASDKAVFGQPEVNLGLIPGWGGTQLLSELIGPSNAKELMIMGENISAQRAKEIGLINRVLPAEKFQEGVEDIVGKITSKPPLSLRAIKRLVNRKIDLHDDLDRESTEFGELFETEDLREGLSAFNEKRKPEFKGK